MIADWIIAGAPKCSTSSIFRWLVDHPDVCGSKVKETNYFTDPSSHAFDPESNFLTGGLAGYEAFFEGCPDAGGPVVESTPGYLYSQTALESIPVLPSKPDLVFVLRDPVAQIRSTFLYFRNNWNWIDADLKFSDFVSSVEQEPDRFDDNELVANVLENAMYLDHLLRWRDAVGKDRMQVLLFEDMVADPRGFMRDLASRMGVDPNFYDGYGFPRENATYAIRSRVLQNWNIALRPYLPKGRVYGLLRSLYRRVNTRSAHDEARDAQVELLLSRKYAPMIPRLEQEFDLDLSGWRSARLDSMSRTE